MYFHWNQYKEKELVTLLLLQSPHKSNISTHMHHLSKGLDIYMNKYDNILFLGGFNSERSGSYLNENYFFNVYNLRNIIKEPTCFMNPYNPWCIDLFLTNRPRCFQNTVAVERVISDFHKMVVTVLKVFYKKQKPKLIQYRKCDNFNKDLFREELNTNYWMLISIMLNYQNFLKLLCLYSTSMLQETEIYTSK